MHNLEDQLALIANLVDRLDAAIAFEDPCSLEFDYDEFQLLKELKNTLAEIVDDNKQVSSLDLDMSPELGKFPPGFFDNPLILTPKDLGGLPTELVEQLSDLDQLEGEILKLMEMSKGTLVLDKIIAGLYHLTGKTHQRNQLTAKLYRMIKKNLIWSVPRKKGVYTTNRDEYEL